MSAETSHDLTRALSVRREAVFRASLLDGEEESLLDGEAMMDDEAMGIFWPDAKGASATGIEAVDVRAIERVGGGQCPIKAFWRCTEHPGVVHYLFRA